MKNTVVRKEIKINNETVILNITYKSVKNINVRIYDGEVHVSANKSVSVDYIEKLILKKADYVLTAVKNTAVKEKNYDYVMLLGEKIPLEIIKITKGSELSCDFDGKKLVIYTDDESDKTKTDYITDCWYKELAPLVFNASLERIYPLVKPFGVPKPMLVFQKMKTRWGVCFYTKNKVKMNINLLKYPVSCTDCVMLHELIHFLCHNHGKEFYSYMDRLMPDWKQRNNILKTTL
jgi:hypothetical protein